MRREKGWFITISAILIVGSVMQAAVRGHDSMYVGGTLKGIKLGQKGQLGLEESLSFSWHKGEDSQIPFTQITAMDYGEHAGRRVAAAILVAWPLLFSHKKRHYLTVYFNCNEAKAWRGAGADRQGPGVRADRRCGGIRDQQARFRGRYRRSPGQNRPQSETGIGESLA